jgi:hypothetical protein
MVGEPAVMRLDSVMALPTLEYGASATLLFDLCSLFFYEIHTSWVAFF